ncbi:MAG TPA: rhomboid family intramembrane serine protease [Salinivirgaceae bacterium]|nr:rhomboid family intramembrane serine protease [Salinivirgaceae bacterium]
MQGYRAPLFGNMPPVVKNIIIINVLMLLGAMITNYEAAVGYLGLFYPESPYFRPYQIVTHMFMHGDFMHLFFNMFALYMFGRILETIWGSQRFLTYYLVTGMGAIVLHFLIAWIDIHQLKSAINLFQNSPTPEIFEKIIRKNISEPSGYLLDFITRFYDSPFSLSNIGEAKAILYKVYEQRINVPVIGASGAVFGVLLAFGMLFPNTELMLLFPPMPIKAKYFVIGYGILELFLGVSNRSGDNVAHFAHLGGMIFGFILIKIWNRNRFRLL